MWFNDKTRFLATENLQKTIISASFTYLVNSKTLQIVNEKRILP